MTNQTPEDEGFAWLITDLETNEYHMRLFERDAFEFAQILGGEPFRENVRCPTPNLRLFGRDGNGKPETRVIMTREPLWWARRIPGLSTFDPSVVLDFCDEFQKLDDEIVNQGRLPEP